MIAFALAALQATTPNFPEAWKEVDGAIRKSYYARVSRKDEMERILTKYAPVATAAKTEAEFDTAMDRMTEEFGDSHFGFFTRAEPSYYLMDSLARRSSATPMSHFGAWLRPGTDGMTVQMVLDGGEAAKAGLRKGDVLVAANGSSLAVDALRGKSSVEVKLRRGAEERTVTLGVREQTGAAMFLDATKASVHVIPFNGRKIGYIHLWTLAGPEFVAALNEAVKGPLKDTDAFVMDLRDGFGGRPEGYAAPFTDGTYDKPLIVLTNEGTRSAKEVLSFDLKRTKRARLVGRTTAGHVLGTFPRALQGDWAYLEIPLVDVPTNGIRLEKRGVAPDVVVPMEFDAQGNDLILARGLDLLKDVPVGV